jgi:cytochrome c556
MRPTRILPGVLVAALFGVISVVSAHEGATGIVKERMDAMTTMSHAMKAIGKLIEANRDLAAIQDEAGHVRDIAAHIVQWFPPGSTTKPTDALPTIWERWSDFQARAAQLQQESAKLATVAASGDPKAIAAQFRVVGQMCTGCHTDYRAKQQ